MTLGTFLLIAITVGTWLASSAIDNTDWARRNRGIQMCAFLVLVFGAASQGWLVQFGVVEPTAINVIVMITAFFLLVLVKKDRLIWGEEIDKKRRR